MNYNIDSYPYTNEHYGINQIINNGALQDFIHHFNLPHT